MADTSMFTYGEILHAHGRNPAVSGFCVTEDGSLVDESVLQTIWAAGMVCGTDMTTTDGRTVRVLASGWQRQDGGPDFGGVRFEMDGREQSGDVEIEVRAAGWYAHGHHLNPRFAKVRLHVFLEPSTTGRPTTTIDGRHVPQLCLNDLPIHEFISSGLNAAPPKTVVPEGRCGAGPDGARSANEVLTFLGAAGDWRLLEKSCRLDDTLRSDGADMVYYEGIMAALGYRAYKKEFRKLARQLPYALMRRIAGTDEPAAAVERLRAMYLGAAGLLPGRNGSADYIDRLNGIWNALETEMPLVQPVYYAWRRAGVRPVNRPERRLAAAATLVVRDRERGIADAWTDRIRKVGLERNGPKLCLDSLMVPADGFWREHYGFGISGGAGGERLVGRARACEILVNAVLPAAMAFARHKADDPLRTRVLSLYSRMPRVGDNSITKLMRERLFPEGIPKGVGRMRARHQQGMLQVYQDWCVTNPACTGCPMLDDTAHPSAVRREPPT